MGKSFYRDGFRNGLNVRGVNILNTYMGDVYYVDSVNGSDVHDGTLNFPKASIDYLFLNDIVKAGDIIIAKPGHVESIADVSAWDIAGVAILFQGEGTSKPYFDFTAVDAYVNVTGAGITLVMPKLVVGIDSLVKGFNVAAADFTVIEVEDYDAANKNALDMFVTTAAALRFKVLGYRFFEAAGGAQKHARIKTVGAIDSFVLRDIHITGDFDVAPVNNSEAATNVDWDFVNCNNTNAGPAPGIAIHANTTGFAENVKCRVASGTAYVSSTAKIQWGAMCQGYNTDGSGGAAIGSAIDIEAKVDSVGVQAAVVQSITESITTQLSGVGAGADSVGVQASTIDNRASTAVSKVDSVGIQTSAAQSITLSRAIRTDSKVDSAGVTASEITSQATSIGVATSIIASYASSARSAAISAAVGASVANANVLSVQASVASQAASVGTGTSVCNANVLSTQASVLSVGASAAVGASVANANVLSTAASVASTAASVGIGTSVCNANIISTSNSVTSAATSLGIGVSTVVNTSAQVVSILNSFALVISTINSKT